MFTLTTIIINCCFPTDGLKFQNEAQSDPCKVTEHDDATLAHVSLRIILLLLTSYLLQNINLTFLIYTQLI